MKKPEIRELVVEPQKKEYMVGIRFETTHYYSVWATSEDEAREEAKKDFERVEKTVKLNRKVLEYIL